MVYDRCPECKAPMYFHAITSVKGVWRRWLECTKCGTYAHTDQFGTTMLTTKQAPAKGALAKNEVLADEGSAADRFGQDDFRNLSSLQ